MQYWNDPYSATKVKKYVNYVKNQLYALTTAKSIAQNVQKWGIKYKKQNLKEKSEKKWTFRASETT